MTMLRNCLKLTWRLVYPENIFCWGLYS